MNLRPPVDTNPSRQRSLSKTLFKPEEFENSGFAFQCRRTWENEIDDAYSACTRADVTHLGFGYIPSSLYMTLSREVLKRIRNIVFHRCRPNHAGEIWKRRFNSEKSIKCFPSILRWRFENETIDSLFGFVVEEISGRKITFQTVSPSPFTLKRKGDVFKFVRFGKPLFSWQISVDVAVER